MTLLSIVVLAGIINNAIVLLDRIRIEIAHRPLDPARAIVEPAQGRFRPILLTTGTTVAGLLPLCSKPARCDGRWPSRPSSGCSPRRRSPWAWCVSTTRCPSGSRSTATATDPAVPPPSTRLLGHRWTMLYAGSRLRLSCVGEQEVIVSIADWFLGGRLPKLPIRERTATRPSPKQITGLACVAAKIRGRTQSARERKKLKVNKAPVKEKV